MRKRRSILPLDYGNPRLIVWKCHHQLIHSRMLKTELFYFALICDVMALFRYRKDIRDDELATPMSIAESGTPMSIDDKSAMEIEQMRKSMAIKSDRDRCFEVAEYQKDILKYLKLVEVNFINAILIDC